ncbi:MAG: hypothetical protein CRN43_05895 [Candidatus Nephrothrix sp. EaCA]|nr:MAG: hypothetical protein CRN43_05895 [Candidatus Nephrothrix sp. EaCA]
MSRILILITFFFIALSSCKHLSGDSNFTPVEEISIAPQTVRMFAGENASVVVRITPADASNKALTWSSSNPAVASVNESGSISALTVGTATIRAAAADGAKSAECTLTVEAPLVPVDRISLDKTSILLFYAGAKETITPAIEPANASNQGVFWFSSMPLVASVSADGVVTAVGKGTSLIIATTKEKAKTAACTVTVSF